MVEQTSRATHFATLPSSRSSSCQQYDKGRKVVMAIPSLEQILPITRNSQQGTWQGYDRGRRIFSPQNSLLNLDHEMPCIFSGRKVRLGNASSQVKEVLKPGQPQIAMRQDPTGCNMGQKSWKVWSSVFGQGQSEECPSRRERKLVAPPDVPCKPRPIRLVKTGIPESTVPGATTLSRNL